MAKKKFISWAPTIIFSGIVLAAYLSQFNFLGGNTVTLTIKNLAPSAVFDINVILYEEPCVIRNLQTGESASCKFQIRSDSHYKISWRESSDEVYKENVGYVTNGFSFEHELEIIGNGAVRFKIKEHA